MKTVLLGEPPPIVASLIAERKRLGLDRHDEIWPGEYHMAPAASFEHGRAEAILAGLLERPSRACGLLVGMAFNLGEPGDFRVPDLGVHRGTPAGVWVRTAAIVVEVRSPDDETYDKFPFYFARGVEEVLVVDLLRHEVHWFQRADGAFVAVEASAAISLPANDIRAGLGW